MPRLPLLLVCLGPLLFACGDDGRIPLADGGLDAEPPARDVGPPGDANCASAFVEARVERLPVDIVWVVDNSVSMQPAVDEVTAGLDDFAEIIEDSGLDYRVIMLSLRSPTNPVRVDGRDRYAVCIPRPLAGDDACGNGERFFHSSVDIKSTQPLEQFLGTLGQTAGFTEGESRGGEPWRDFLRDDATKSIVVVSDDDSRLSPTQFETFGGGSNPFNSTELPPGILDASWDGLFEGYVFHGLYGWGSETDPRVACTYPGGEVPPAPGETYTALVERTGGVRASICDGASAWGPFFEAVASSVTEGARIACEIPLPAPPDGMMLDPGRVNVVVRGEGGDTTVGKVSDASACAGPGGWYYDDDAAPSAVILCETSCALARDRVGPEGTGVSVQFGCETILI